jgi:fission process protein 1
MQSAKKTADKLADKDVDSTDTELRYAAYGARLRTALRASQRYLAYVRPFQPVPVITDLTFAQPLADQ